MYKMNLQKKDPPRKKKEHHKRLESQAVIDCLGCLFHLHDKSPPPPSTLHTLPSYNRPGISLNISSCHLPPARHPSLFSVSTMTRINSRILILSDTHAHSPATTRAEDDLSPTSDFCLATTGYREPLPSADVALHGGDLTTRTTPWEFRRAVAMLRGLRAPLKIVIPGNHDRALDEAFWTSTQESSSGVRPGKGPRVQDRSTGASGRGQDGRVRVHWRGGRAH